MDTVSPFDLEVRRRRGRCRRRRSRVAWRRAALWIAFVLVLGVGGNVYYALRPGYVDGRVRSAIEDALGLSVSYESVGWSFDGGVEVSALALHERGAQSTGLLEVETVRVVPRLLPLAAGRFSVAEVVLVRPVVYVERASDGRWNLAALGGRSSAGDGEVAAFPSVRIEAGRVRYRDEHSFEEPVADELDDVYAVVRQDEPDSATLRARFRAPGIRRVEVEGTVELAGGVLTEARWQVRAAKVDLGVPFRKWLPESARRALAELKLSGAADVRGEFLYTDEGGVRPLRATARIRRCDVKHPLLPFPVRGLGGTASIRGGLIELRDLRGLCGSGQIAASASIEVSVPEWRLLRWNADISSVGLSIDGRTRAVLPEGVQRVYDLYHPRGIVDATVTVADIAHFPPALADLRAVVQLRDVNAVYAKFPYPVEKVRGEVRLENGWIRIPRPLVGRAGPARVEAMGAGAELTRNGAMEITVKAYDVPFDERFRASLPASFHRIWDDFRARGRGDAVVEIRREAEPDAAGESAPGEEPLPPRAPRVLVTAYPRSSSIVYRGFPYSIGDLTGEIRYDTGAKLLSFVDLKGRHDEYVITGNGAVELSGEKLFNLELHTDRMRVDDDLRAAMSPATRTLLEDFRVEADVAIDVAIQTASDRSLTVTTEVEILSASMRHQRFPYDLEFSGGRLEIVGDHTLRFRDVRTPERSSPKLRFGGEMTTAGTRRTLGFSVDIERFRFDDRLVDALPAQLVNFVRGMKLGGIYRGKIRGNFEFDQRDPDYVRISYSGEDIVAEDAEASFGLKVRNIGATGAFVGKKEPGRPHSLVGRVDVASAWFNRIHLTDLGIHFVLGREHELIAAARRGEAQAYEPPLAFLERLRPDAVDETYQAYLTSKNVYGGDLDGFIYVGVGDRNDIAGHFVAKDLEVAKAAQDVFGAEGAGTRGLASGHVAFRGRSGDVNSIRGKGRGTIREARLVQLPLFLGLIGVLFGDTSGGHFFRSVDLSYDIRDGKFDAGSDGIHINSAGIKLRGGGTMDFTGNLDLTLLPRLLNVEIIGVEQLFKLIKHGTAKLSVTGDLGRPKVDFVTGLGAVRIGIDTSGSGKKGSVPLPSDLRGGEESGGDDEGADDTGSEGETSDEPPAPQSPSP